MTDLLPNFVSGQWQSGKGAGTALYDPVLGTELVRVDAHGLDLAAAFAFARHQGGRALRSLSYAQRAAMLGAAAKVLQANRDAYYDISIANSGTVKNDTAVDVDGGIYTLGTYAKMGEGLGNVHYMLDGQPARLAKDPLFQSQHVLTPTRAVALFINAFNFPAWGLWEKAAPALLSGVPVIVKPATTTAWLTQRMVKDVVDAGIFPAGAISVICGSSAGLMDQLQPFDVVSFTGSAETAAVIRSHRAVTHLSVRVNIEADSVNCALLLPSEAADGQAIDLLAKEVAREMTVKSGQKCTAIRRVLVPEKLYDTAAQAISARLAKTTLGNPRNDTVRMGAVVNREQFDAVHTGLSHLKAQAAVCTMATRMRWSTPMQPLPAALAPHSWARVMPQAAMPPTASTTPKSLALWPPWCPTATTTSITPCNSSAAARAPWWPRSTEPTQPHWHAPLQSWPAATAVYTSSPPMWPPCTPATAT